MSFSRTPKPHSTILRLAAIAAALSALGGCIRPLYGPNINFRVDAGDLPEFSLYLPGHGGNLKLGLSAAAGSKWLAQAAEVVARYRPGRMIYEVRDPLLAQGSLRIEVLTVGQGAGFMPCLDCRGTGTIPCKTCHGTGIFVRKP